MAPFPGVWPAGRCDLARPQSTCSAQGLAWLPGSSVWPSAAVAGHPSQLPQDAERTTWLPTFCPEDQWGDKFSPQGAIPASSATLLWPGPKCLAVDLGGADFSPGPPQKCHAAPQQLLTSAAPAQAVRPREAVRALVQEREKNKPAPARSLARSLLQNFPLRPDRQIKAAARLRLSEQQKPAQESARENRGARQSRRGQSSAPRSLQSSTGGAAEKVGRGVSRGRRGTGFTNATAPRPGLAPPPPAPTGALTLPPSSSAAWSPATSRRQSSSRAGGQAEEPRPCPTSQRAPPQKKIAAQGSSRAPSQAKSS